MTYQPRQFARIDTAQGPLLILPRRHPLARELEAKYGGRKIRGSVVINTGEEKQ